MGRWEDEWSGGSTKGRRAEENGSSMAGCKMK